MAAFNFLIMQTYILHLELLPGPMFLFLHNNIIQFRPCQIQAYIQLSTVIFTDCISHKGKGHEIAIQLKGEGHKIKTTYEN